MSAPFALHSQPTHHTVTLTSPDHTNRLRRSTVVALTQLFRELDARPVILTGNQRFFSAGADLREIHALTAPDALAFAHLGQQLMSTIARFPAPVIAAVRGYCMGGGFDLALACHLRVAAPNAVFAHRGAALGIITGWGGTQRLPRLLGKARALQLFLTAETLSASRALSLGLVTAIDADPVACALRLIP